MTDAGIQSLKTTVMDTSRILCGIDGQAVTEALAPNGESSPIACTRSSTISLRALRLTGADPAPP